MTQYRDFVSESGLDKLDIGILCLNAGVVNLGPIDLIEDDRYEAMWNVTGLHNVYLLKALTKQLLDRSKRSAVLLTSSYAADVVFAGGASYSATKAMVSNFGEAVHYELKTNVDVTVWEPGMVHSNIHIKDPPNAMTMKTDKAVSDILT